MRARVGAEIEECGCDRVLERGNYHLDQKIPSEVTISCVWSLVLMPSTLIVPSKTSHIIVTIFLTSLVMANLRIFLSGKMLVASSAITANMQAIALIH